MKKIQLSISGMHCASCATILTKALQKVSGVKEATVNYSTERASVDYDSSKTTIDQLLQAVAAKGYKAVVYEAARGKDREDKRTNGKRRIFCKRKKCQGQGETEDKEGE